MTIHQFLVFIFSSPVILSGFVCCGESPSSEQDGGTVKMIFEVPVATFR